MYKAMKIFHLICLSCISYDLWAVSCVYVNDLGGLTPAEFKTHVESGEVLSSAAITLTTWFNTNTKNQDLLFPHIHILGADCERTPLYRNSEGSIRPVLTTKISVPFGDLYQLYVDATVKNDVETIEWLYKYTKAQAKDLEAYLKLWRLVPPIEFGGLETQLMLMQIFRKTEGLPPKQSDLNDQTVRNSEYTGNIQDYYFAKLYSVWGGKVEPKCGPYPLAAKFELQNSIHYKRPYQKSLDLMAEIQKLRVSTVETHPNLVKIPVNSDQPIMVDFVACLQN